jgi:hypothetical protein
MAERLLVVKGPVFVEVAGEECCTEQQDGLGTCGRRARATDAEPAPDQMTACAFDDAGGDGEAVAERVA